MYEEIDFKKIIAVCKEKMFRILFLEMVAIFL